jgi:hypothetical protein
MEVQKCCDVVEVTSTITSVLYHIALSRLRHVIDDLTNKFTQSACRLLFYWQKGAYSMAKGAQ